VKFVVAIIIAVVLTVFIVGVVHTKEQNDHRSGVLAVYDKCLNESSDGHDCQMIRNDCGNGDTYACQLTHALYCLNRYGAGCPDDTTG
jgi:hypothetical protein